jgi:hypothetical protein
MSAVPDWKVLDTATLSNALSQLPVPLPSLEPPGISIHDAIKARTPELHINIRYRIHYRIRYSILFTFTISYTLSYTRSCTICYMMFFVVWVVAPPRPTGIITGSEQILKEYAKSASLNARDIIRLIEDVLHNPNFNAEEVDTDMLKRFADSIDSGDLDIMHQAEDGAQKLERFRRPPEKVLRELMSDIRLAGSQHFGFKEYLDPHGNRLFAGHANGSVSFQLAHIRIGDGKVPVSLVIYIDATYIKKGIPILPVYCK